MRAAGLRHKAASAGLHDCTPVDRQRLLGPCRRCRKLSELAWPCTGQQPNRYLLVASKDVPLVVILCYCLCPDIGSAAVESSHCATSHMPT